MKPRYFQTKREKVVHSRQCEVFHDEQFRTVLVRFIYEGGKVKVLSVVEQPQDEIRHLIGSDSMDKLMRDCKVSMIREGVYHD